MGYSKKIGELLVEDRLIREEEANEVLKEQKRLRLRFGAILVRRKRVSEEDIARALSTQYRLEYADIRSLSVMPEALVSIPEETARENVLLPIRIDSRGLVVMISDPLNIEVIKEIEFTTNRRVYTIIGAEGPIKEAVRYHYRYCGSLDDVIEKRPEGSCVADSVNADVSAPVIRLVNMLLSEAVESRASDIHLEPFAEFLIVRFRIDGVLNERTRFYPWVHGPLTSRIKILARLNIAEKRLPQDGGFRMNVGGKNIDFRVSIMPVSGGEKTVIRVLDESQTTVLLEDIGLSNSDYSRMQMLIRRKKGIVLVTGPTGSGKTTTLYAIINRIKSGMINIVTVEDPVEYRIDGISQTMIRPDIGLTFARCLRSLLRQDPDVILVGEIRDEETAEIAFRAAMTGHLVLSTLHTNDAASTITRLVDIGIPRYIIASAVIGIVAQRLVRKLCPACRTEGNSNEGAVPKGCLRCSFTGYHGRSGIFEVFTITSAIRGIILAGGDEEAIKKAAEHRDLTADAFDKVRQGITTIEEVYRVTEGLKAL